MATFRPFTPDWTAALREAINASTEQRAAARGWTWPLALVLDRVPAFGYPEDLAVVLDLHRGDCRGAALLPATQAAAPFTVRGEYAVWKRVLLGDLDPISAIMTRALTLEGSLVTMMAHSRAAKALVRCAAAVPTIFPDEEPSAR
jgi:putative sterol carrier protein